MAVREPIFQNTKAYSEIEDSYICVYSKRLKDIGSTLETKFYWIYTNSAGDILPKKNRRVAFQEYDNLNDCIANIPFGFVISGSGSQPSPPTPSSTTGTVGQLFTGTASAAGTIQIFIQPSDHMVASVQTSTTSPYSWSYTPETDGIFAARLGVVGLPQPSNLSATWTVSGGSGGGGDGTFESTTLMNIINGSSDVAVNTMGIDQFPSTPINTSNYAVTLYNGTGAEWLNKGKTDVTNKRVADFLGNNRLWSYAELPAQNRSTWLNFSDLPFNVIMNTPEQQGRWEAGNFIDMHCRDKNGSAQYHAALLSDLEKNWSLNPQGAGLFMYGFQEEAVKYYPNFRNWFYGVGLCKYLVSFNLQGDGRYVIPKFNPELTPFFKQNNGVVQALHANKNIIFDCTTYAKAPVPSSTTVYQKVGSTYITDSNGNRVYRTTTITESYRGITHTWNLAMGEVPGGIDVESNERYAMYVPEWHIGMYYPYILYGRIVTAMQMIRESLESNASINTFPNSTYKIGCALRQTLESNTWQGSYRPMDKFTSEITTLLALCLTGNLYWWDDFNKSGYGIPLANSSNDGNQLKIQPEGTESVAYRDWHNGMVRQSWGVNYLFQMYNRDYGLFTASDKLLFFTDILLLDTRRELLGFGRYNSTTGNVFICLNYPITEYDETCVVTIGNTQNSVTHNVTLTGRCNVSKGVYQFAGTSNLQPNQIWIQYTTIKGTTYKLSGDLNSHTI